MNDAPLTAPRFFGAPTSRVDGPAKVTGAAHYAGDFPATAVLHGVVVGSTIARGRITEIDDTEARRVPGMVAVYSHLRRPDVPGYGASDDVAPSGTPFGPLRDDKVLYSSQPIAFVLAESSEAARYAASLLEIRYVAEAAATDLRAARGQAVEATRKGAPTAPGPRGDAATRHAQAPVTLDQDYFIEREYHHPMEPHATTVIWQGDRKIRVHDKTQGVQAIQQYLCRSFSLTAADVRVVSPYIGGAFGAGLRPNYQLFLAVMAALDLRRSVRLVLNRDQMFSVAYRPETIQTVRLGAERDGTLRAIQHEAIATTSRYENYQETVVDWSGALYSCDNVALSYKNVPLDCATPTYMRAPGAATGLFALESAMDELAHATGVDPVALRLRNYAETDGNDGKPHTSKALREAYAAGAARFGWEHRSPAPRSMRQGSELIGWGMASGMWDAMMMKHAASATFDVSGRLTIACATADIGTGTYTILAQIAADAVGLAIEDVTVRLADSDLPKAPLEGGSWTAASAGAAVQAACMGLCDQLFRAARAADASPLANAERDRVVFAGGRIANPQDTQRSMSLIEALRATGRDRLCVEETAERADDIGKRYAMFTHAAVFAEVRVDEGLGVIRVTRVVSAIAAGKIINPKTAASQVIGGVVWGIGMALHEEAMMDPRIGRIMNHNFAEYHLPANADTCGIEVIFVDERDDKVSPLGVKGVGEIGTVGTAAAIANAVFHATGRRVRSLPMTIDKLL